MSFQSILISMGYDSKVEHAKEFCATMQNKFHYVIIGQTATEKVVNRIGG